MDTKTALQLKIRMSFAMYKLDLKMWSNANRECDLWDNSHGFGFDDEFTWDEYDRAHECDEFKALWAEYEKYLEAFKKDLDAFCKAMVAFTDGQIDYNTAKNMATNSKTSAKLEEMFMGKVA